jgi:hypothetical protein
MTVYRIKIGRTTIERELDGTEGKSAQRWTGGNFHPDVLLNALERVVLADAIDDIQQYFEMRGREAREKLR